MLCLVLLASPACFTWGSQNSDTSTSKTRLKRPCRGFEKTHWFNDLVKEWTSCPVTRTTPVSHQLWRKQAAETFACAHRPWLAVIVATADEWAAQLLFKRVRSAVFYIYIFWTYSSHLHMPRFTHGIKYLTWNKNVDIIWYWYARVLLKIFLSSSRTLNWHWFF
jgi:hypothetical protein